MKDTAGLYERFKWSLPDATSSLTLGGLLRYVIAIFLVSIATILVLGGLLWITELLGYPAKVIYGVPVVILAGCIIYNVYMRITTGGWPD